MIRSVLIEDVPLVGLFYWSPIYIAFICSPIIVLLYVRGAHALHDTYIINFRDLAKVKHHSSH